MKLSLRLVGNIAFILFTFVILGFHDFSGYTDAGLHYEFAEEIARFMRWPLPAATSIGMMSHYPPAAHILSLLIGWLAGSTLYGMFIVTSLSFIIVYGVLAELMRRESVIDTFLTYLLFLMLALVCRPARFLEGNEIIANFFFSQFAGTAALLGSFLFISRLKEQPFVLWLGITALATHLVAWAYTVNAIVLALSCVALQFLDLLKTRSAQSAARVLLSAIVLGAASVIHPTMIGSLGIAANDGGISISTITAIISYLTLLLGTLALGFSAPHSKLINFDGIIALSLGVLGACSLQALAFAAFNIGSAYAVKKYGFLMGTMSLLVFASFMVGRAPNHFVASARRLPASVFILMVPLFGISALLTITAFRPKTPVQQLVRYDREVRDFLSGNVRSDLAGNTVSWSSRVNPHVNYTVGFGVLRPLEAAVDQHALLLPNPQLSGAARYILADAEAAQLFDKSCIVAMSETLAAIRANCELQSPRLQKR